MAHCQVQRPRALLARFSLMKWVMRNSEAAQPCEHVITNREKSLLQETVILGATLDRVDFEGADLRGSRFERVYLSGCDFRNANLLGVWFLDCDLMHANFSGAKLGQNSFHGSCLSGAVGFSEPQRTYVVSSGGSFRRAPKRRSES